ncbi:FAD-dependent oxidoreductase [Magnetovibrio sp. PR-2]|uniref:FAD-dependent oxidoreductase n=1 Tax=Magnetovibrio sp. PR-2 TaxID=3120356 RepID=UPI002FCE5C74
MALKLAYHLNFEDLYDPSGLAAVDRAFMDFLGEHDGDLKTRLTAGREAPDELEAEADLLVELSPVVDAFVAELFAVQDELGALSGQHVALEPLYACKRLFVQRRALKGKKSEDAETLDGEALCQRLEEQLGETLTQISFSTAVMAWLDDADTHNNALQLAQDYALWATLSEAGQLKHKTDILFRQPEKLDYDDLVHTQKAKVGAVEALELPLKRHVSRDGFKLIDPGCDLVGALDEAHYCVLCHERDKDSCSKGLHDKKTGEFAKNPLGVELAGCPLEEKISEMHTVLIQGHAIAALAMVAVDNPLCALTGHRICNDCMKACIYQKQEPVNIPEVETRVLKDVLSLPWGFEIYSLLTRWNPLDIRRPLPRAETGYKVLVVGTGPAGANLSHQLMNEGHSVVAIDGAKIEPLDPGLSGVDLLGERYPFQPVHTIDDIREDLDTRAMAGFGGVAEYGITVRWDKNFLKVVRLLLERRKQFRMYGGVRFGAQITKDQAYAMGFDHIALCMGAGKPTVLDIKNNLARGVRQASDFLMALQLTGAAKHDSLANLQLRMPVVVIGGGLTAIDTATEALAYYVEQVERFVERYDVLAAELGRDKLRARWSDEDEAIADEYMEHGRALRYERACAKAHGRPAEPSRLLERWGGATIAYRRRMVDAPSYRLNHEEITKALEQGVRFAELLSPTAIDVDQHGWASGVKLALQEMGEDGRPHPTGEMTELPARAVLIAAGTQPNTVLTREDETFADLDGKYFQAVDAKGIDVSPEWSDKPQDVQVLMDATAGRTMSFFGDLHPSYAGNVVRALASTKQGYPVVDAALAKAQPNSVPFDDLVRDLDQGLIARVVEVKRLTPNIVEVIVKAPFGARAFKPGQFFRLQNFETLASVVNDTRMAMEGLALTGAWVDKDQGIVSTIVLEMGGSSKLCRDLEVGEPIVLMGPTGAPTETPGGETVLLAGGGLGNAVLFSIGQALRAAGSKVLYFAGYKNPGDRYHVENIEAAADTIVWCTDVEPAIEPGRHGDFSYVGNIVEAMKAYGTGALGTPPIALSEVDRVVAIGSDIMMNAVKEARHGVLKDLMKPKHTAIASINAPMQCMMKEICAQCLQRHVDPETGVESVVFTCFNQDQPQDLVDFGCLNSRLKQNAIAEKLTAAWIEHCHSTG